MTEPTMTLCNLVRDTDTDQRHPGSQIRWCNICAAQVWAAPSTLDRTGTEIVCIPCGQGAQQALGGEIVLDERTRTELRALGYSDAFIDRLYAEALAKFARDA